MTSDESSQRNIDSAVEPTAEDGYRRARAYAANLDLSRPILGAREAPATIIEFGDFQCVYCAKSHFTIKEIFSLSSNQVRYAFRHLPMDFFPFAMPSAKYFEAVAIQSQTEAWRFHDAVLENQRNLNVGGEAFLWTTAAVLNIDAVRLKSDLQSERVAKRIADDIEDAKYLGFDGTPTFIVNGYVIIGAHPIDAFQELLASPQ